MDAMKFAAIILFVVLASKACTPAAAQDIELPLKPGVRQADSSAAQDGNVNRHQSGDDFEQARSETGFVSNSTAPANDEQASTDLLSTNVQGDCDSGCRSSCCSCPCPTCYAQVEALFLQREPRFSRQAIVVDPNTGTTFLSTSDLDFDDDPGLRATIGMPICGRALEFTYFGLSEGNADAVASSSDPAAFLIFPNNLFGNVFVDADRFGVNYSSALSSFELNLPCCCGCCDQGCDGCSDRCGFGDVSYQSFEWFTGFRYVNLGENLNITAQRDVAGGVEQGTYDIRTTNHLYGAQIGMRERQTRGQFGWEATGKVGIFGNDARETQTVTDFPNFQIRPTVSSSGGQVAFIGDTNISALYRLTNVWNLRAGYNLIWIEGLALAPDQLDFDLASATGGSQLHSGGGMFLHGVNVGIEARW